MLAVFVETSALFSYLLGKIPIPEGGETEVVKKYFRQGQQLMQALSKAGNGCTTIYVRDEAANTISDKLRKERILLSERGESVRAFIERESGVDGDDQLLLLKALSTKVLHMLRIFHLFGNERYNTTGKHHQVVRIEKEISTLWKQIPLGIKIRRMKDYATDIQKPGEGLEKSDRIIIAEASYLAHNDLSDRKVMMATYDRVIVYFNDFFSKEFKVSPDWGGSITSLVSKRPSKESSS